MIITHLLARLRPHLLVCTLLFGYAWAGTPAFAEEPRKIASVLQPFVESQTLAGAVTLVASPEKTLSLEAVGWADVAAKKPMRTDAVFWIASQSKPITAAALMILVDERKVNADDPVEKYLPEFKGHLVAPQKGETEPAKPRHAILVRELLSHTSGLPFKSDMEQPTLDVFPLAERVRSYAKMQLLFQPGTKSQYSNAGINTAGRIIEVVSGMPYEKFLDERLFQPLGMKDTTFWPAGARLERVPKSYKPANDGGLEAVPIGQLNYPLDDRDRQPMPAGGLFSTATDLAIFYRMLANSGTFEGKRVLSQKAVDQMTSDQSGEAHSNYGFGMGTNGKTFTHGGAYNTNSAYDRELKIITVFLVQHAGWGKDGKTILPAFQKAARDQFGVKVATADAANPPLVVGIPGASKANAPTVANLKPAAKRTPPVVVNRVRFFPAPEREHAMVGGKFTGSKVSASEGYQLLAEIKTAPKRGEWSEITFENKTPYRWVRYEAPAGSHGNIAELQFFSGEDKLRGSGFGTAGALKPGGHWKTAFDDKPETWFNSNNADGQSVGLDFGGFASPQPIITPAGGDFGKPQLIRMDSRIAGATIRYTLDGTTPTRTRGCVYCGAISVQPGIAVKAIAYKSGMADSEVAH